MERSCWKYWVKIYRICTSFRQNSTHSNMLITAWKLSMFGVIQSECGKMWTRITPNTDIFYAANGSLNKWSACILANIQLFKVSNTVTRKRFEICSKLTIKTSFWRLYCQLWANCDGILVSSLLTLNIFYFFF